MSLINRPGQQTIGVFVDGKEATQLVPFKEAMYQCGLDNDPQFRIVYIYINDIKDNNWSPQDLVNYLLQCHAYFIITHIHQGKSAQNESQLGWNMHVLQTELIRLAGNRGYPRQEKLRCPVFLQDKVAYLSLLPNYKTLPTMKACFNAPSFDEDILSRILS